MTDPYDDDNEDFEPLLDDDELDEQQHEAFMNDDLDWEGP